MKIDIKGVSISQKRRKDGRYQGYIVVDGKKRYFYDRSYTILKEKLINLAKSGELSGYPKTFSAFFKYYFEKFKKRKVAKTTYECYISRFNCYLKPFFREKPIKSITPSDCQDLLNKIKESGKGKTADEVYSMLSIFFKGAILHNIIARNPLDIVYFEKHERQHGKALTIQEEKDFLNAIKGTKYEKCFAVALFTGLRPNELKTAKIDGQMIIAENSKRKNKKVAYKRIPISKKLKPYLPLPHFPGNIDELRRELKKYLPNHILYDLRTTFYSRCKECGISAHAYEEFMGHSLGEIGNAYTDLSDDFLIKEMQKFDY